MVFEELTSSSSTGYSRCDICHEYIHLTSLFITVGGGKPSTARCSSGQCYENEVNKWKLEKERQNKERQKKYKEYLVTVYNLLTNVLNNDIIDIILKDYLGYEFRTKIIIDIIPYLDV